MAKRGRPPSGMPRRLKRLSVFLRREEYEVIAGQAEQAGLSASEYTRKSMLKLRDSHIKVSDYINRNKPPPE